MWFFLTASVLFNFILVAILFAAVARQQAIAETNVYLRETLQMYLTEIVLELEDDDEVADGMKGASIPWQ